MLTPRGPLPQKVYWRRRMLLAAAGVLAVVTASVLVLGGGSSPTDGGSAQPQPSTPGASRGTTPASTAPLTSASASTAAASPSAPSTSAGPVQPCDIAGLAITASTDAPSYPVTASPALRIVVTNTGAAPCTADLSDQQIELFVYFGDARIWGSHDCNIEPGTAVQTLPVGQAVTREIVWTGLSSVPGCAATRQRVAAGTYTLRPTLSGVAGAPATFAFA